MPGWLVPLLPIPAIAALCFHANLFALVSARSISPERLERDLAEAAGYVNDDASIIGTRAGEKVMNLGLLLASKARRLRRCAGS